MDESSFFRNSDIFQETNRIIEAQRVLSKINNENFESTLLFFQNSIFVTSKKMAKSFIRSILNIIRFKSKNLELYSNLCKNIDFFSNITGHILIGFLKNADFMTPSQFKFYRICMANELITAVDIVKQISVNLYLGLLEPTKMSAKQLIPLFLWFCPEIYQYNNNLFHWFYQKLQKEDFFTSQVDLLKYDNFSIFYQYAENQYINIKFHPIYLDKTTTSDNFQRIMKENSIEYCLKEDDINKFQELTENKDINSNCQISLFDYFFQPTQQPSYLQFSAANSSINCFKYLISSNADLKTEIQNLSTTRISNETQFFREKRNQKNEIEVIEIDSSSESERKSDNESENHKSENESSSENKKSDNEEEDVIYISDSESNDEKPVTKNITDEPKPKEKEIIIISDSSSDNDSDNETAKTETETETDKNCCISQKEMEIKSKRLLIPPDQPGDLTASFIARKPLCYDYKKSMSLKTTAQCTVVGGDNEIVRHVYDSELNFNDTPQVAIFCFYNDLAKWIIEVVLSSDDESNSLSPQIYAKMLHCSITSGNIEMLKYVISNMPNEINGNLKTLDFIPLHLAIQFHQIDVLSFLLNLKSVDVNKADESTHKTPFFLAVDSRNLEMVRLISKNPFFDFNQIVSKTLKPIHYIAMYGTSKMLKFFISLNGVDVNDNVTYKIEEEKKRIDKKRRKKKPKKEKSKNFIDDAEFLFFLDDGTSNSKSDDTEYEYEYEENDENEDNNYYFNYKYDLYDAESRDFFFASQENSKRANFHNIINTPIVCSLLSNYYWEENFFVLINDPNLDINTQSDQMPLHLCIKEEKMQIFDYLITNREKIGLDIDIYDKCGTTALHYAVLRKKQWAIQSLIKAGCDITKRTKIEGDTICHLASFNGSLDIFKSFGKFFEVNVLNAKKQTPLHYATIYGSTQIVDYLLTLPEIDINAADDEGNTALHHCIQNSQRSIFMKLLSNRSIDVNAMNNDSETPLIFAFKFNNEEFITKLLSLDGMINPNCCEKATGNTPLHLSVILKSENLTRRLLKLQRCETLKNKLQESNSFSYEFDPQVDVNSQNLKGLTALHIAAQMKSDILVRVILTSPNILADIVDFTLNRCPIHYSAVSRGGCFLGMKIFNPYMYDLSKFSNTIFSQLINKDPLTGNIQDSNGDTPFHIALNEAGFDGNLLKNTAMQVNKNGFNEILNLTLVNLKGENYLHLAAASGNRIVLDFMVKTHPELINSKTIEISFC